MKRLVELSHEKVPCEKVAWLHADADALIQGLLLEVRDFLPERET